jgi:hypothetical protein
MALTWPHLEVPVLATQGLQVRHGTRVVVEHLHELVLELVAVGLGGRLLGLLAVLLCPYLAEDS